MATTAIATFGRFNIFHEGHQHLINHMFDLANDNTDVLIGFSKAKKNRSILRRIDEFYEYDELQQNALIHAATFSNLYVCVKSLSDVYDSATLVVGTDNAKSAIDIASRFPNIHVLIHNRQDHGFSSSLIRSLIEEAEGDFENFCEMAFSCGILNETRQCRTAWIAYTEELN